MPRRFDGRDDLDDPDVRARVAGTPGPQPLRSGLERVVQSLGAPPVSIVSQLRERWPDIVGTALAETTRPVELVDGTLTVACTDAAWAARIGWMETQIRQRFEAVFGSDDVNRVVTRVDR